MHKVQNPYQTRERIQYLPGTRRRIYRTLFEQEDAYTVEPLPNKRTHIEPSRNKKTNTVFGTLFQREDSYTVDQNPPGTRRRVYLQSHHQTRGRIQNLPGTRRRNRTLFEQDDAYTYRTLTKQEDAYRTFMEQEDEYSIQNPLPTRRLIYCRLEPSRNKKTHILIEPSPNERTHRESIPFRRTCVQNPSDTEDPNRNL